MSEAPHTVFIGIGSNLGNREEYIEKAVEIIASHPQITLIDRTQVIETVPWGNLDQPDFLNAVARIKTYLDPVDLLKILKDAEQSLGRKSGGQRWGPRQIDLDILIFGSQVLSNESLTIPHMHLIDRKFVIEQILELDSSVVHPKTGSLLSSYLK